MDCKIYVYLCLVPHPAVFTSHKWIHRIYVCIYVCMYVCKGKAIPLQGLDRPRGFQKVEAPRFQDKVVSCTHRPPFLLKAESTPGPQCGWEDYVNE